MRIAYFAAGAGGMYCGSCMHDNRLAASLIKQGRDVVLIPLYTPLRTDEPDVSVNRVFCGGINAYLQQSSALFRGTPWFVDRVLDSRVLLNFAGRFSSSTCPEDLGPMTVSILQAERGRQRKEVYKLVAGLRKLHPDVVYFPNAMFAGSARFVQTELGVPVVCGLTGEDIFLDRLPQPHRDEVFALIGEHAKHIAGFVALSDYYRAHAITHFELPAERVHVLPMGILVNEFARAAPPPEPPTVIGYLARVCPEKGLHHLVGAAALLRAAGHAVRVDAAGYLGQGDRAYFERTMEAARSAGLDEAAFTYRGELTRAEKIAFLQGVHIFAAPTEYRESKGLYALEALAAGLPLVLPHHGSFPELAQRSGAVLTHHPGDPQSLADVLAGLITDPGRRRSMATRGCEYVREQHSVDRMADAAWDLFTRLA